MKDQSVTPVLELLLAHYAEEIAKVDRPPLSVSLRVGDQVELLLAMTRDECCEGLAWVRVSSMFPSANFPEPDGVATPCGEVQWAAVLELGAARCAPVAPVHTLPSSDEWTAKALEVQDDAAAMRRAVCAFTGDMPNVLHLVGAWTPLPTEGGCVGGIMPVTVAIGACDCP